MRYTVPHMRRAISTSEPDINWCNGRYKLMIWAWYQSMQRTVQIDDMSMISIDVSLKSIHATDGTNRWYEPDINPCNGRYKSMIWAWYQSMQRTVQIDNMSLISIHATDGTNRWYEPDINPCNIRRVGQNRIYTYIYTVYLVIFKPKLPMHAVYIWFWPTLNIRYSPGTTVAITVIAEMQKLGCLHFTKTLGKSGTLSMPCYLYQRDSCFFSGT